MNNFFIGKFLIFGLFSFCESYQDLLDATTWFCSNNGFKYVTYVKTESLEAAGQAMLKSSRSSLRSKVLPYKEFLSIPNDFEARLPDLDFNMDFVVIFANYGSNADLKPLLERIVKRKIRSTLLVLAGKQVTLMKNVLSELQSNCFFYLLKVYETASLNWSQIITMNGESNVVENNLSFDASGVIIEDYDFGGMQFVYTSLTWAPYLTVENCNEMGRNCTFYGFMGDMMDNSAKTFNFTWDIYADIENNWGLFPTSGPYNLSGEWGGVFGDVVAGKYPLSLSSWSWIRERFRLLDFVSMTKSYAILAVVPQLPEVDYGLFIRPFRNDAWMGIGIIMLIGLVFLFGPWVVVPKYTDTTASQIVITSGWYCFVLLNAFYGGALTMFFVGEITLPFNNIREVIQSYPNWKLMIQGGNEALYKIPASKGDPDYMMLWDQIENNKEETVYSTVAEGIELLESGQVVIHVMYSMLTGHLNINPFDQPDIRVFGAEKATFWTVLLTYNSPIKPMLTMGSTRTFEQGAYERLSKKWEGQPIRPLGESELMVLTAGQVFVMFGILVIAIGFTLFCLFVEVIHVKSKAIRKNSSNQRTGLHKYHRQENISNNKYVRKMIRHRRRSLH